MSTARKKPTAITRTPEAFTTTPAPAPDGAAGNALAFETGRAHGRAEGRADALRVDDDALVRRTWELSLEAEAIGKLVALRYAATGELAGQTKNLMTTLTELSLRFNPGGVLTYGQPSAIYVTALMNNQPEPKRDAMWSAFYVLRDASTGRPS